MKNGNWRINISPSLTVKGRKATYDRLRDMIFHYFSEKCTACGFNDRRALQIDHINGGGSKERKIKSGSSFLYHVLKHIEKYQILCANCNWIKRTENHEQFMVLKG